MNASFETRRRVEFCDTDAAGIAHFSSFFFYMEQTEHELLRQLGASVVMQDEQGTISWPRVAASCEYRGAVRFEELIDIQLSIERLGEKSVAYSYRFMRDGQLIAEGKMTAVCCRIVSGQPPRSMPIPDWLADKLRHYVSANAR